MDTRYISATRTYPPMIDNSMLNNALSTLSGAVNNHADMIDKMYAELNDLKGFYMWVTDTYPEHMQQYRAILDLKKASE
jgi:hypothetical protein